jgi:Fe-S cluster assembly iron-binding protein IscA
MLSVTDSAKALLKEELQKEKRGEENLIRIALTPSNPNQLGFFLDKLQKEDQIIEDNEGERLLVVSEGLAHRLNGVVLDCSNTEEGIKYTLSRS